jgi:hypothetical protein
MPDLSTKIAGAQVGSMRSGNGGEGMPGIVFILRPANCRARAEDGAARLYVRRGMAFA